jgi:hypothetical protein
MNSRLQRWWLWGCFVATLLASWAGGFGVTVTAVFIGIYLTGLVLIGPDEPAAEAVDVVDVVDAVEVVDVQDIAGEDAEPYPDDDESETVQTDTTIDTATDSDSDSGSDSDSDSGEILEPSDSSR